MPYLANIDNTQTTQLNDKPLWIIGNLSFDGIWTLLLDFFGYDADETINLVTNRVNYNRNCTQNGTTISGCHALSSSQVEKVLKTYNNLVLKDVIPMYDRKNNPSAIENIEEAVTHWTGLKRVDVNQVLYELYFGVLGNNYNSNDYAAKMLRPKDADVMKFLNEVTPKEWDTLSTDVKSIMDKAKDKFDDILYSILKYVAIAVVGFFLITYGMPILLSKVGKK